MGWLIRVATLGRWFFRSSRMLSERSAAPDRELRKSALIGSCGRFVAVAMLWVAARTFQIQWRHVYDTFSSHTSQTAYVPDLIPAELLETVNDERGRSPSPTWILEQTPRPANLMSPLKDGEAQIWIPLLQAVCEVDSRDALVMVSVSFQACTPNPIHWCTYRHRPG